MSPGAISQLAQSEAPAFRVRFHGSAPPPGQRYWRGPVLWHNDGRTWSAGRTAALLKPVAHPLTQVEGEAVRQSITLESQNSRWLIGLDVPVEMSVPAINTVGFQWLSKRSLRERTRYEVVSYPRYRSGDLDPRVRKAALQLPDTLSKRIETLAQGWRNQARTERDVVRLALDYFHNEPFVYTLTPPQLGVDPLDEFLFSTRRGFCEHYAAAFVTLMRSAGIPARVVTGYQGGEYNPVGEYWLVRQADAHAWAEIWLTGRGWERVDPTAAVAPERIEHALDPGALPLGAPVRFQFQTGEDSLFSRGWRRLRYSLDAINNSWDQWVLSYGPELQQDVLAALGFSQPSWQSMTMMLTFLVSALLLIIAAWLLIKKPVPADPVLRVYRRFCARIARLGIRRRPAEGPRDFSRRIITERPEIGPQVNRITELFILLRYGRAEDAKRRLVQLERLVRQFPRIPA
jgi:transglutaminase-like putative cysteine protease